jgi:uncharacterized protein with PIN domain
VLGQRGARRGHAAESLALQLTLDIGLRKRSLVQYGYWVRATDPEQQLFEVCGRYGLAKRAQPFSRCVRCNGLLRDVAKQAVWDRLPAGTRRSHQQFRQCEQCDQIFWAGSHYDRMTRLIDALLTAGGLAASSNPEVTRGA